MARIGPSSRNRPPYLPGPNKPKEDSSEKDAPKRKDTEATKFGRAVLEGSTVALLSLLGLGLGGYTYNHFYKRTVEKKIEKAFSVGYSSNEKVALGRIAFGDDPNAMKAIMEREYWMPQPEQALVDDIINGKERGRYYLITGERGTGKRSLLLNAMSKIAGDGIAMLEAHNDLEVFRLRLGKALDFEFHEDYIGSLFSIRGPRDSTPLLDIERALNKMEKVALKMRKARGKPLVLIVNNIHLIRDEPNGQNLLEILQQRAEIWAANDLVTTVFTSDEHFISERLTPHATNMQTITVRDATKDAVILALRKYRARFHNEDVPTSVLEQVYQQVGGRLIFLKQVSKSQDMLATCQHICRKEKAWFLAQCWILGDMIEEEAEENQNFCIAAMFLALELVRREEHGDDFTLPEIPLHEARQIIGRPDFTQGLDHINVIHIDSAKDVVRADSVAMQNAFREICTDPGFEEHLEATIERLDELESLSRTREVSFREPPEYEGKVPVQTYCAKL